MSDAQVAILVTVIVNLLLVAFMGGRLWQKVNDNCRRLSRIESIINGKGTKKEEQHNAQR